MKVLFFITSSMEKPSPSWHLMKALLEDTLQAGISVHAIQKHFSDSDMPAFPENILNNELFSYSKVNDKNINRRNFVMRYLKGIVYSLKARKYFKQINDYDVVFIQSSPTSLYNILTAKHFAKDRPIIYNCQDMFPGSAVANGSMPHKWMQNIFYMLQKIAYKYVDVITAISGDMKKKLLEQGVPEEIIRVIVNWYDDAAVHEVAWEDNRFVEKYKLQRNLFYVQYAGTMGTNFNPKPILEVAERLKNHKEIVFQMIGDGVRREVFEQEAQKRGLDNIVFYPLQSQDMVSEVYSACSICLIPLQPGVIGNSVPSKAGLLMACGRVIVNSVDENSEYAKMFEREKIGSSAGVNDYAKLAERILFLYQNPQICAEYGARAKEYGKKEYSRIVNTRKYIELFYELNEN